MPPPATVLGVLRQFLPGFLQTEPPLFPQQRRAIWAITHCRTPAMGGQAFACEKCGHVHFAFHSCNHKACPQCGRQATHDWVQRELSKRIAAPYFMVTFTLPAQLRECFFGPFAKQAYDLFFTATAGALAEKLASAKGLRAHVSGFTAVLHTWNQRLLFHPHIHCLVPGAGLDASGNLVCVKCPTFLVHIPHLQAAFREHMRRLLKQHDWQVDPRVWSIDWGVHIQPVGSGASAIKYLGAYVARTAIGDSRIIAVDDRTVTFRWIDRSDHHRVKPMTLPGSEFVARYLRHVLPQGLRSIRYYGFCHPAAKANRLRVQLHSGRLVDLGSTTPDASAAQTVHPASRCIRCGAATRLLGFLPSLYPKRGPPRAPTLLGTQSNHPSLAA